MRAARNSAAAKCVVALDQLERRCRRRRRDQADIFIKRARGLSRVNIPAVRRRRVGREQKSIRKCLFVARNNIVLVIHDARVQPVEPPSLAEEEEERGREMRANPSPDAFISMEEASSPVSK